MKKLTVILAVFLCALTFAAFKVEEQTKVYHLFTHALVAYPEIAFKEDNTMGYHYDRDCLLVSEFKSILAELYKNDFVLIDISDVYGVSNGIVYKKPIRLYGKKPLILSFDDINYYEKKMNLGMNDKLILDSSGEVATYTKNVNTKINYDNEVITVTENFIKQHPEFSHNGAKGVICLTGYDGILGYRTDRSAEARKSEIAAVTPLVNKLKQLNWKFACHSYGHYHTRSMTLEHLKSDTEKWQREVAPIVGNTNIYVFPYGEHDIYINGCITEKQQHLISAGFNMFFGVGNGGYFDYLPFLRKSPKTCFIMDRVPMDGISLRKGFTSDYFDSYKVYNHTYRPIPL